MIYKQAFSYNGKTYEITGNTPQEAMDKKINILIALTETPQEESPETYSVDMWFEKYIQYYKQNITKGTRKAYLSMYKNSIRPYIGYRNLESVSQIDCQMILNNVKGKSGSYIKKVDILMKSMFRKAIANQLITYNPTEDLTKPPLKDGHRRALTEEERKEVVYACKRSGKYGLFFLVTYYCGLRMSEAARIKGKDIDRERRILHVNGTKTLSATRDVFIPYNFEFPPCGDDELLFGTKNNTVIDKSKYKFYWKKINDFCERFYGHRLAEDLTPYCLRHDYCTRLQEAGVPIDIARRLMGHSSVEITSKIYTHGTMSSLMSAAELVNDFERRL